VSLAVERERCVIIGAGPAGLTAGWEARRLPALVLERDDVVGGLSRTVEHEGFRFDLGGHRFFTKVPEVAALWREILGPDLLPRPRLSRIRFGDRFFDYPLRPLDALRGLGPFEALRVVASFARARLFPYPEERSFEQWVVNRFGRRLFEIFFESYTEKVWGMSCAEIGADWAAQRIKNLDLAVALRNALLRRGARDGAVVTSLIERFEYPRLGPGMLWERCRDLLEADGVPTRTGVAVTRILHDGRRVRAVEVRDAEGAVERVEGASFVSSMPLRELVQALDPPPPPDVLAAAERLRYRDFLTVALVVDRAEVFPDNWIYVHAPEVKVGRIQNFKNWSPEMVPDPAQTALGLEYFVQEGDALWNAPDAELVALARRECAALGLVEPTEVRDGVVVRVPKAYPVYDATYRGALDCIRSHLKGLANLQLVGRNGQHRYNNQDHSMVTALRAVRNLAGASYDVWDVNVDDDYHETAPASAGGRLAPAPLDSRETVASAFARYDVRALAGAVACVVGAGVFAITAIPLLRGQQEMIPVLSLLSNYLYGYRPAWEGAWLGLLEGAALGGVLGALLAGTINAIVGWHRAAYLREVELASGLDAIERGAPEA
jgi:protoporphyrinogen oxidase